MVSQGGHARVPSTELEKYREEPHAEAQRRRGRGGNRGEFTTNGHDHTNKRDKKGQPLGRYYLFCFTTNTVC